MDRIKKIFYSLSPIKKNMDSLFFGKNNVVKKIYNPPSYIIKILFLGILSCYDFGSFDKIKWSTFFSYKGVEFLLHDYKFGSSTIKYQNDNSINKEIAEELIHKIKIASKLIDKELSSNLKVEISKDNFYLKNSYNELISIYEFYREKYIEKKRELENLDSENKHTKISKFTDFVNKELELERESQYYIFSLVTSFFSLSEFVLISILSFSEENISYKRFGELSWSERFLKVFNVKSDNRIHKIYDSLLEIRKDYRNPLSHGLWSRYEELLVPLAGVGLIPISYEFSKKTLLFSLNLGVSKEKILKTFDEFFNYINSDSWFKLIIKYLKFSFPIPFNKKEIKKIKIFMKNENDFTQYLENRAEYEDAVINRMI